MLMRTFLIFALFAVGSTFADNTPSTMSLPKSGALVLTSIVNDQATRYDLSFKTTAGNEVYLEAHEVMRGITPPTEWCALLSCDENSDVIVALMELNEFSLMLVQYDLKAKVAKSDRVWAPRLLQEKRATGGSIKVAAPNRLILTIPNYDDKSWSVVEGKLIDGDGTTLEQGQTLQLGTGTGSSERASEARQVTAVPITVVIVEPSPSPKVPEAKPSPLSRKPTSSTTWSVVGVLIVAVTALLWLLLKGRK